MSLVFAVAVVVSATVTGCRTELWPEVLTNNPQDGGHGDGGASGDLRGADLATKPNSPDLRQPNGGFAVGDPCMLQGGGDGCGPALFCLGENAGFPNGYCTQVCDNDQACPSDSVCSPAATGELVCLKSCSTNNDCRLNYECDPTDLVCVPAVQSSDQLPPGTLNGAACVSPTESPNPGNTATNVQLSQASHYAIHATAAYDAANDRVAVAWYDYAMNGTDGIKVAVSNDGGKAFGAPITLPRGAGMMVPFVYYPYIVVDSEGTFYVSWLGYAGNQQTITAMNVFVAASTDGGKTFSVVRATPMGEFSADGSLDAPRLAVGPDKSLALTWTQYDANAGTVNIRYSRSTDQGKTWSAPITLSASDDRPFLGRNLATSTYDASGNAYVVWFEYGQDYWGSPENAVYLQKVDAMGALVGGNQKVTGVGDSPSYDWPSVALSGDAVVVGYANGNSSGAWDVRVRVALDGTTFGGTVRVNDDSTCATHFHHAMATDADGGIHVVYYDNRYLVGNLFATTLKVDSATGNFEFGATGFVNAESFPFSTGNQDFDTLSDYVGVQVTADGTFAAWSDPRDGIATAWFALVLY